MGARKGKLEKACDTKSNKEGKFGSQKRGKDNVLKKAET